MSAARFSLAPTAGRPPLRARRPRRPVRVEVLPLIDVVFLLLAVLLLSMVRMVRASALPVELPQAASAEALEAATLLVVGVRADGRTYLAGDELDAAAIGERVRRALVAEPDLALLVQADRAARHGDVAELLDALRAAGAARVWVGAAAAPAGAVHVGEMPPAQVPLGERGDAGGSPGDR